MLFAGMILGVFCIPLVICTTIINIMVYFVLLLWLLTSSCLVVATYPFFISNVDVGLTNTIVIVFVVGILVC